MPGQDSHLSVIERWWMVYDGSGSRFITTQDKGTADWYRREYEYRVDGPYVLEAQQPPGAVEAFAQERQAVLDCVNLYGDETLHKALDAIGWPGDYIGGQ